MTCSICIVGTFERLVYEWLPIFSAQVYELGGFEMPARVAHPYQNDPKTRRPPSPPSPTPRDSSVTEIYHHNYLIPTH